MIHCILDTCKYIRDGRAPIPSTELISKRISAIKYSKTKPELILRKELWSKVLRGYRVQLKIVPDNTGIAFPGKKIAIFVNGCFWHRCPKCDLPLPKSNSSFWKEKFDNNVKRDKIKKARLEELG